jgi:DNA-binding MarR family transcriptional regulator
VAQEDREELAAMFARIARRLIDAERPVLEAHGLTMWQYVVLSQLAREPAQTQLALARAISYDKTRLIALLDSLEAEGLVSRMPDPSDRRGRIVTITDRGEKRRAAAAHDIRTMEDSVLEPLSPSVRTGLLKALGALAAR